MISDWLTYVQSLIAKSLITAYMQITFRQVSKRYNYDWIFKGLDHCFERGQRYAITGPNGSGKSTLMRVVSSQLSPSKGKVVFELDGKKVKEENIYRHLSYAAPYIELIEEFTLFESIRFHQKFKPFQSGISTPDIIDVLAFPKAKNKEVRHFSSGMKQRLKLALALCSESSFLLLDEPTTNLDQQGMDWYLSLAERFISNQTVIVASNIAMDYSFCNHQINILDYK